MQIRSHRAVALEYLDRRAEALREHRRVAEYEKRTGDLRGFAKSLNNIGIVYMNQKQWKPAIAAALEQSCTLKRDLGDFRGIAKPCTTSASCTTSAVITSRRKRPFSKAFASASAAAATSTAPHNPSSPSPMSR